MEREYEFFVTTDKPYNPAGAERCMIRRLVMRNHFDMKMAGPQINPSQHSSISTAMAKKKLKNRFRISEPRIKKEKANSRERVDARRLREKGAARLKDLRDSSGPTTFSKAGEDGKDKRNNMDGTPEARPVLKCGLDDDQINPSKVSPIPGVPELGALFQLYKSAPKNNAVAIDAQHTWKSLISTDAGLLHATLASWALYGMLANELADLRVCKLKHKNEAIKAVNCKLATSGGYISDEVVATVLTLANLENLLGDYETAKLHVTALKRMVKVRGGLFAFGHHDGLLRGITWMDFHTAAVSRAHPSFPHISLDPDTPALPDELKEEAAKTSPTSLLHLSCGAVDCFNIFYRLHRLALAVSSQWVGRVERLTLSNLLYETQFMILSIPDHSHNFLHFDQSINGEENDCYDYLKARADAARVVEALLAAALIFVYAVLRALPLNTKIFAVLLSRLRTAIDRPNALVLEMWRREKNLNMLLWVLVVASCVATGEERMWWIAQLSELCGKRHISSRQHLELEMRHVAWTDKFFEDRMDAIWAEVMRLRGLALCRGSLAGFPATTAEPSLFDG